MAKNRYRVAQFGAFDVESMGDAMFPSALSFGLEKYVPCEIDLFSVNSCLKPFNNNKEVFSISQFAARNLLQPYDAVVLGGGEFLNFSEIHFGEVKYPPGYLWQEPIRIAKKENIKVFINCIGVSEDFSKSKSEEIESYIQKSEYVSVRDSFSQKRLYSAGILNASCVADNLWYMNQMYPKAQLASMRQELEKRFGIDLTTPYLVAQYGTTRNAKLFAEQLQEIKARTGHRICLMAVNYCHEDREGMRLLAEQGNGEFETWNMYLQPPEMMAVISGAHAFLGTSLHGNLTAASYDVPFIGLDMYASFVSKMDGIFSMVGCEDYLVPNEAGIAAAYFAREKDSQLSSSIAVKIQEIQHRLDDHFKKMAEILKGE